MADTAGFIKAVQAHYGMRPTVPFQTPIAVGDIGYIGSGGVWNPVSTARQRFGVEPEDIRRRQDERGTWDLSSGKDVKFQTYAKGQTSKLVSSIADAHARAEIEFANARSFVFAAKKVMVSSATQMDALIEAIRLAYHNRKNLPQSRRWDAKLVFIFAVADAARFVAVLADYGNTTLAVSGSAKVGPPSSAAELTAGVSFGSSSNELQTVNVPKAQSCFYRAYQLDPKILKRWKEEEVREVRFAASGWQSQGLARTGPLANRAPATVFGGEVDDFGRIGAAGEVGFRMSARSVPSFEKTFREV
jgi:hypothetical protein